LSTTGTSYIEHSIQELLSQRIHGLVLGYEDLNDHDHLRRDPVHGLICGKRDPLGQDRVLERDKGKALAAHSTLNRLELSAQGIHLHYHKIETQPEQFEALLIKRGVKQLSVRPCEWSHSTWIRHKAWSSAPRIPLPDFDRGLFSFHRR
jgi:hypothetical protein